MASIRKRRGKWQVRVRRDGVAVTKTFTFRRDASTWAREIETKADRALAVPNTRVLKQTRLAELVTRYKDEVTPKKRGADNEVIVLNAFLRHAICQKKLADLTVADFVKYRDERLKEAKNNTLRRQLSPIQNMFKVAHKQWGLPIPINLVAALDTRPGAGRTGAPL
jgi:hypothetical protein